VSSKKLEQSNAQIKKEIKRLQEELSQQNKARKQQEDQVMWLYTQMHVMLPESVY